MQNKFIDLYEYAYSDFDEDSNKKFIIETEDKEKEIIHEINNNTEEITQRIRTAANDSNYQLNSELKNFYLPKVKFYRTIKPKRKNFYNVLFKGFTFIKNKNEQKEEQDKHNLNKIINKYKKSKFYMTQNN